MELAIIHNGEVFGIDLGSALEIIDLKSGIERLVIAEAIEDEVKRIQEHD